SDYNGRQPPADDANADVVSSLEYRADPAKESAGVGWRGAGDTNAQAGLEQRSSLVLLPKRAYRLGIGCRFAFQEVGQPVAVGGCWTYRLRRLGAREGPGDLRLASTDGRKRRQQRRAGGLGLVGVQGTDLARQGELAGSAEHRPLLQIRWR